MFDLFKYHGISMWIFIRPFVHPFFVPILNHRRGFSASAIERKRYGIRPETKRGPETGWLAVANLLSVTVCYGNKGAIEFLMIYVYIKHIWKWWFVHSKPWNSLDFSQRSPIDSPVDFIMDFMDFSLNKPRRKSPGENF